MLKHVQERQGHDGLNSMNYTVRSIQQRPLYTRINVIINQRDVMNAERYDIQTLLDQFVDKSPAAS